MPRIGRGWLGEVVMLRRVLCSCVLVLGTLVDLAGAQAPASEGMVIDESRGAVADAAVELVDGTGRVVSTTRTGADMAVQHRAEDPSIAGTVRLDHKPDRGTVRRQGFRGLHVFVSQNTIRLHHRARPRRK